MSNFKNVKITMAKINVTFIVSSKKERKNKIIIITGIAESVTLDVVPVHSRVYLCFQVVLVGC